jgi:branched-chain amino acid aminotransferase
MIVYLNGQFVPEAAATVSIFDRSFQYGDGLFETIRFANGKPFHWEPHLERLAHGAGFLGIRLPFDSPKLAAAARELVRLNGTPEGMLRITLSRGIGQRGYSPTNADHPVLAMSLHPTEPMPAAPRSWRLHTSSFRLPDHNPLAICKTANKLIQVMARAVAETGGAEEALLLNTRGEVCETSSGNLFWIMNRRLHTPPADAGLLPGVTRSVVLDLAPRLGLTVAESRIDLPAFMTVEGAFVTLSSLGIVEVAAVDGTPMATSPHTRSLSRAYQDLFHSETA